MKKITVLLTAVGCPGGPSIIQGLRQDDRLRIVGVDMNPDPPGKYLVDAFYPVPPGRDKSYIPRMLEIVEQESARLVLPLATFELQNLAANQHSFVKRGCIVCVSDPEPLEIANNRYLLFSRFSNEDFVPGFRAPKNLQQMKRHMGELGFPQNKVVIKPFISHGSIGLRIVDPNLDTFSIYRNQKPSAIFTNMRAIEEIFADQSFSDILVSEFLPGKEYGIDLLLDPNTHKVITGVVRDNGEVHLSAISSGRIIKHDAMYALGVQIAESLGLSYAINIDIKLDRDGRPKLMEINPRLPATSFLAFSAGLNLPLLSVKLGLGEEFPLPKPLSDVRIYLYRGFLTIHNNRPKDRC
ncbi:MAG: ATP-grasp domain-containing protein [Planctomycetes bacterium]|nr:ATP-grasp domain-containing protein [Planctomycetota bacterium]